VTHDRLDLQPARFIRGTVPVPGDKSISHRYAMLSALAEGTTEVTHLAPGADVAATVACLRGLGVGIESIGPRAIRVNGRGRAGLRAPERPLDAANSGTTMRLLSGILAGCPFTTTLEGDPSLSRRPMRRVIDPLTAMGARIDSQDGRAPLVIAGGNLQPITWRSPVASAQVKSAIMLAALVAEGTTVVIEPMATRDHSERAFPTFGLASTTSRDAAVTGGAPGAVAISVTGPQHATAPAAGTLRVPGDPSTAAVWAAAAAALPGSSVELTGVCLNPHRLGFVRALERMGASIQIDVTDQIGGESVGTVRVSHGEHRATVIAADEVPSLIDELPVLAARAALGGGLEVSGASELRVKESDRITALVSGFRAMGVDAAERPDGFVIDGGRQPRGGTADAASDHRLVMAFTLVGLGASGPSTVTDAGAVAVSYPDFTQDLARLLS
jgi:3-phosphoshikimate 1-carboxyvinyltransferase